MVTGMSFGLGDSEYPVSPVYNVVGSHVGVAQFESEVAKGSVGDNRICEKWTLEWKA